jgi:hypothetical protein
MDDRDILAEIGTLVEEERELERQHTAEELPEEEQARLKNIEVALDRCWDLLRQRRARRNAGLDPDQAELRPAETVRHYRQ